MINVEDSDGLEEIYDNKKKLAAFCKYYPNLKNLLNKFAHNEESEEEMDILSNALLEERKKICDNIDNLDEDKFDMWFSFNHDKFGEHLYKGGIYDYFK